MKISELIQKLSTIQYEHGDIEVKYDAGYGLINIDGVLYKFEKGNAEYGFDEAEYVEIY